MEALEITQSKASRHLISLRHAGLVRDRKDGLWSYYSLNLVEDELSKQHLQVLQKTLARHPDSMGLLNKLHMWIETRNRGVICAENNACAASKKRRAAAKAVSGGQR
jgi:ArsR family transcriptional regulator